MPLEGYEGKKPAPHWWFEQIAAGEKFRKKMAHEDRWDVWRRMYRGQWRRDIMPTNVFFATLRTTVPRIYFRNPTISVAAAKPGLLNLTFARILERIDNKLIRRMRLKKQMKRIVQEAWMFGTGWGKLGYGALFSPEPDGDIPLGKRGELLEFADFTESNMPWFARVPTGRMVLPDGLMDYDQAPWIAEEVFRPVSAVQADPRFENAKKIAASTSRETLFGIVRDPIETVRLWEIRDRRTGGIMVLAPDQDESARVLFHGPDRMQLYGGYPYFPVVFNEDDQVFWGVPDSIILEPMQNNLNEARTQIAKHRRASIVKLLVQTGQMEEHEAEKMISEDVDPVVFTKGDPNRVVRALQSAGIPPDLITEYQLQMQDLREVLGFSRNQFGEFNSRSGDTTATEAQIVRQAVEIRIDERRDTLADTVVDIIERMHGVIFDNWREDQIVDVVGPGGLQVFVNFRGDLLKSGRYSVKVDPDSSVPETRALREQRATQLYQLLVTNPLVDPIKLTQYLLTELRGVQFDDMMKMLPPPEGGVPSDSVGPADFAQMLGNSLTQIGRPGATPALISPPKQG